MTILLHMITMLHLNYLPLITKVHPTRVPYHT